MDLRALDLEPAPEASIPFVWFAPKCSFWQFLGTTKLVHDRMYSK